MPRPGGRWASKQKSKPLLTPTRGRSLILNTLLKPRPGWRRRSTFTAHSARGLVGLVGVVRNAWLFRRLECQARGHASACPGQPGHLRGCMPSGVGQPFGDGDHWGHVAHILQRLCQSTRQFGRCIREGCVIIIKRVVGRAPLAHDGLPNAIQRPPETLTPSNSFLKPMVKECCSGGTGEPSTRHIGLVNLPIDGLQRPFQAARGYPGLLKSPASGLLNCLTSARARATWY
jgi:hypothetical protein